MNTSSMNSKPLCKLEGIHHHHQQQQQQLQHRPTSVVLQSPPQESREWIEDEASHDSSNRSLSRSQIPSPLQQRSQPRERISIEDRGMLSTEDVPDLWDEDEHEAFQELPRAQSFPTTEQQQQQQKQPFFLLDWMIEDLVPKQQNAHDLANLFQQQSDFSSPFRKLRKSRSLMESSKPSAMQQLFPWLVSPFGTNPPSPKEVSSVIPEKSKSSKVHILAANTPPKNPQDDGMPETPKSSNRRACKIHHNGHLQETNHVHLLVPMNLETKLEGSLSPKLLPKTPSSAPSSPLSISSKEVDLSIHYNESPTKKSASCPQFLTEEEEALQERKRQQQIDRRERRNKLTIVQRSLTLAQSWNNKGIAKAGKATQSEQEANFELAHSLWETSLHCWDNALEIYRSLLGDSHEKVADVQNNRGIALGKLQRYEQALFALGMALEARKKQFCPQGSESSSKAAIVSTLHNIANVHRDAMDLSKALMALLEAKTLLETHERNLDDDHAIPTEGFSQWQQAARLHAAIGHVHYEAKEWNEARDAYRDALDSYDKLSKSVRDYQTRVPEDQRLSLLHFQHSIQTEVTMLEDDWDELDRRQQATDGTRARLFRLKQQEQQQQQQQEFPRMGKRPQPQKQQQQQQQPTQSTNQDFPSLLGLVSSLRT